MNAMTKRSVELLNADGNTSSCLLPDLNVSRVAHTQNVDRRSELGSRITVCGGGGRESQKTCDQFDWDDATWKKSHDLHLPRWGHASWDVQHNSSGGTLLIGSRSKVKSEKLSTELLKISAHGTPTNSILSTEDSGKNIPFKLRYDAA